MRPLRKIKIAAARRDNPRWLSFAGFPVPPPRDNPAGVVRERPAPADANSSPNGRFSNRPYETMKPAFTAVGGIPGRHSGEGRNPGF